MSDLKSDLASLQLNEAPASSRKGLWILLAVVLLAATGGVLAWRSATAYVDVTAVSPTVEQSGQASAGTPVLTASGYIVARREAIVSSKIQGRLSELSVGRAAEGE